MHRVWKAICPGKPQRRCRPPGESTASSTRCPQIGGVFTQVVHSFVHRPGPAATLMGRGHEQPPRLARLLSLTGLRHPPGDGHAPALRACCVPLPAGAARPMLPARRRLAHGNYPSGPAPGAQEANPRPQWPRTQPKRAANWVKSQIFPACRDTPGPSGRLRSTRDLGGGGSMTNAYRTGGQTAPASIHVWPGANGGHCSRGLVKCAGLRFRAAGRQRGAACRSR